MAFIRYTISLNKVSSHCYIHQTLLIFINDRCSSYLNKYILWMTLKCFLYPKTNVCLLSTKYFLICSDRRTKNSPKNVNYVPTKSLVDS